MGTPKSKTLSDLEFMTTIMLVMCVKCDLPQLQNPLKKIFFPCCDLWK